VECGIQNTRNGMPYRAKSIGLTQFFPLPPSQNIAADEINLRRVGDVVD